MKILQIIQRKQLRGAEIFACQLTEELRKAGYTVDVVFLFDTTPTFLHFDLPYIALHADPANRLWDIGAFRRLAKIVESGGYDIVQANAGDTLKYAVFSRFIFGWRAKIIFRNASLMSAFMRGFLHRAFNRWLLKQCDYIISVSKNCRLDLIEFYPQAEKSSITIPIGTYTYEEVSPEPRGVAADEPIFINISSLVPEKNHAFLIMLFHRYFEKYGRGYLWLVGNGKLFESLKTMTRQLNIEDRVLFWGYRNDVIAILKAADIFVMPSRIEGLPGAILEALSCRVPVIASNVGGIPEIILHEVNGFCMAAENLDLYMEHVERMTLDEQVRARFANAAYDTICKNYLMPHIAGLFLNQYRSLMKENG